MIIFSALLLFLYTLVAWRNREYAIILLVAALPLYLIRFSLGPIPSTLLEGMISILFAVWLVRDRRFWCTCAVLWYRYRFLTLALSMFLIAATISIFMSSDLRAALGVWRAYFIEPAAVFLVAFDVIRTKEQLSRMFCASVVSGVCIAAIAVYQRFTGWHIPAPWLEELRVTSIYSYPNAVGLYLAPIVPLALCRFFEHISARKKIMAAVLVFCAIILFFAAIYFAKTEGALVALAVVLPLMGLVWSMKTRIVTVGLCVVVAVFIFVSPPTLSVIQEKLLLSDWSGQVRQTTWKETGAMLVDHAVLGAGLAGYQNAMVPYHTAKYLEIFLYPHDIVLNFWSETGLLGLLAFFLIVCAFFFLLFQSVRAGGKDAPSVRLYCMGLCGALLIILIHGLVDAPYFKNDLSVFFWLLIAYAVIIHRSAYEVKNI